MGTSRPIATSEANNIDDNARNIGNKAAPVDTVGEVVGAGLATVVELPDLKVPFADEVVVGAHDTGDGRENTL